MDLLKIKPSVEQLLQTSEKCRESDARLVACIWNKQLEGRLGEMTAEGLLKALANDEMCIRDRF